MSGRLYIWTKKHILSFYVIWKNAQESDVNIIASPEGYVKKLPWSPLKHRLIANLMRLVTVKEKVFPVLT
jgi:hypothetical protein